MISRKIILVALLLVLIAPTALTQLIYKWRDKKGQWHFSDHPPAEVRAEKVKGLNIGPIPPVPPQISEPPTSPEANKSKENPISVKQPVDEITKEQSEYKRRLNEIEHQIQVRKERVNYTHDQIQRANKGYIEQFAPGETIVVTPGGRYLRSPRNVTRPGVIHSTSPARSIVPKGSYNEIELERLTNELEKLFEQRDKLVREMKQKGFETSFIPY